MLEELLALGFAGAEYDAWLINIGDGDQFGSGFVAINPNSKIPAMVDRSGPEADPGVRVGRDPRSISRRNSARCCRASRASARSACRGSSGRWAARLSSAAASATSTPMRRSRSNTPSTATPWRPSACSTFSTAGSAKAAISPATPTPSPTSRFPWFGGLVEGWLYSAAEFLSVQDYKNVRRWVDDLLQRPAVKRGRMVNRTWGDPAGQLRERHDAKRLRHEDPGQAGRGRGNIEFAPPAASPRTAMAGY